MVSDRFGWYNILRRHHNKSKTLPTTGPVFGSFKHQIDVFVIPIRLYIAALHNNALGVGLNMSKVLIPQFLVNTANTSIYEDDTNRGQVNPSSLLSYLGIKGFGYSSVNQYVRRFPAMFNLAYWDIFKTTTPTNRKKTHT